eukprot:TRINITY_DN92813_c0_g1_i1.p1 TRINITY_DN92813_c0_g1~~TRINITY_DN92813_c0_g1_i1.p1  ORF type:complete len:400 (-),score=54.85 TRINITY_DN92813_c0_g1_i1:177-1298(-)
MPRQVSFQSEHLSGLLNVGLYDHFNGQSLKDAATKATERAVKLQGQWTAALAEAVRAGALSEMCEAREECEREIAQRCAAFAAQMCTQRAKLRIDRLQHGVVEDLEQKVEQLQSELSKTQEALAVASRRCSELELALQCRRGEAEFPREDGRGCSRELSIWRRCLTFCTMPELGIAATASSTHNLAASNEGLWEVAFRRQYPGTSCAFVSSFRAAAAAKDSALWYDVANILTGDCNVLRAAMRRSVCWNLDLSTCRSGYLTSASFDLLGLKDCSIAFCPRGTSDAECGQCSLFMKLTKGVEIDVAITMHDGDVERPTRTMQRYVGKNAKGSKVYGFSNFAVAPQSNTVTIVLDFSAVRSQGQTIPFGQHDVYL